MTYELAGETLVPNLARECRHPYLLPAGECEMCDIDWLLETGHAEEPEDLEALRTEKARELCGEERP
jgi:hypothetical protein